MRILQPRDWKITALRGVAALAFGIVTLAIPGLTVRLLLVLFGVFLLVDGVVTLTAAIRARRLLRSWWIPLGYGSVAVLAGVLIIALPGVTAVALLYVIAASFIVLGIAEAVTAFRLRKELQGEGWIIAGGLVSVLVGAVLAASPGVGVLALSWLIGVVAIIFGMNLLVHAWRLYRTVAVR